MTEGMWRDACKSRELNGLRPNALGSNVKTFPPLRGKEIGRFVLRRQGTEQRQRGCSQRSDGLAFLAIDQPNATASEIDFLPFQTRGFIPAKAR